MRSRFDQDFSASGLGAAAGADPSAKLAPCIFGGAVPVDQEASASVPGAATGAASVHGLRLVTILHDLLPSCRRCRAGRARRAGFAWPWRWCGPG